MLFAYLSSGQKWKNGIKTIMQYYLCTFVNSDLQKFFHINLNPQPYYLMGKWRCLFFYFLFL